jgi:hypothetical protein
MNVLENKSSFTEDNIENSEVSVSALGKVSMF